MKKINPILILSALGVAGALYYFLIYKKENKSEETSEDKSEDKSKDKSEETKEKPKVVIVRKNVYSIADNTPIYNIDYEIFNRKQLKKGSQYIFAKKGQLLGKLAFKSVVDKRTYLVLNSAIDNKYIMVWDRLATIK